MTTQEKKLAAAMAAVAAYMQQEEEAYYDQLAAAAAPLKPPAWASNLWGQSGRQGMMQLRNLMQMKALHRF